MGKEEDLFTINERFRKYYKFIKEGFEKCNHTLSGMGINPYRKYNNEIPIPNERYLMLYHHLKSYTDYPDGLMDFHDYPGYGMFSSASQVQLDVPYDDLIGNINVFSKLEPIKALLFSNSLLLGDNEEYVCFRDILWEYSTHGINPHNIGMYDLELGSIEELMDYAKTEAEFQRTAEALRIYVKVEEYLEAMGAFADEDKEALAKAASENKGDDFYWRLYY